MGEAAAVDTEFAGVPEPESVSVFLHRRIEFHPARKPFNGFGKSSSNGFKLVTLNPNQESHKAAGSSMKSDKLELSESSLDPELTFQITFRRIGAGLRNLGNTCFLNSVLQCLTYTEPLAAYLQSGKHQTSCRTSGFCALCAIQKHVSRALQATGRILEPKDLVSNLRCISRNFRNARQEDAHEYMVNLLESMHKCCLPSGVPTESASAYEKSLVHRIFGGRLRSQVKCMQCSYCSNKFDPFLDLSLEIMKADSLHKALAHFTAKEQLDGGAKVYHCQQCNQKVRAFKQLTIHNAPHVLTVHLKRFSAHSPGQKIDKKVAFGPTLDLKPYVTGAYDGDLNYTLYGVLVHAGWSTHSGHYYCFVRTSSGMWYSLDDNQVVQVNERKVLEQKAYMLFYVRDRRNFGTKKSVGVSQKQNMVMNAIGNAASKLNRELKEKIQNGSIEKKLDSQLSVTFSERETLPPAALKETPLKLSLSQNPNSMVAVDTSVAVPPRKDTLSDHSAMDIDSGVHKGEFKSKVKDSCDPHSLVLAAESVPDQNASAVTLPNGKVPQDSLQKKESSDFVAKQSTRDENDAKENPSESTEVSSNSTVQSATCTSSGDGCTLDATNFEMHDSKIKSKGESAEASNDANDVGSSIVEDQVGCTSTNAAGNSTVERRENGHTSAITEHALRTITKNKRPVLKVKRKTFKGPIAIMSLTSNIIFGVGFGMRKKKPKRSKNLSLQNKSGNLKNLLRVNESPPNSAQSVDKSLLQPCTNQHLNKQHNSGNGTASNDEFRERVNPDSATLSAEEQPQTPSASGGPGNSDQKESRQADVMSMLTRGLEETTVARWDGIDGSLTAKLETQAAGTTRIGYIGDEWDEEYDKGKRKKIRDNKIIFGGPNLFQEIATRNSKRKRAKLDRFNSGNHPVRI